AFRFTTGEQILSELTQSIRCSVQANLYGKVSSEKRKAFEWLFELNARLDVVQSLLMLAWELKFLSHGALVLLTEQLELVQRQVVGWRKWFQNQFELDS
ncbi:four helix bundle protein, partial [Vibrio parahaemolyticus]